MERDTVGKIATDLMQKTPDTLDPIELQREMQRDYEKHFHECVQNGIKTLNTNKFYVVVEQKKEKLLPNVVTNYFIPRRSCPTPHNDQTVYYYDGDSGTVQFLWVVPSKDTCELFKANALEIVPEERGLLKFVLDFEDGTLLRVAKKRNNEDKADLVIVGK